MPTRNPDIVTLLTSRIDHMEANLTSQIHEFKNDLGVRVSELSQRVGTQNGRVGKLEQCLAKLEVEVEAELAKPAIDKRKVALIGTGGIIGGAGLIEVVKWFGEALHSLGILG